MWSIVVAITAIIGYGVTMCFLLWRRRSTKSSYPKMQPGPLLCRSGADAWQSQFDFGVGFQNFEATRTHGNIGQNRGESLFTLQPRLHVLHNFLVDLHVASQQKIPAMNPLAKSCQQSEGFIGRPARPSQRVTAQKPVLHRVADRHNRVPIIILSQLGTRFAQGEVFLAIHHLYYNTF